MRYTIDDLQGGNFCEWSYYTRPTRKQIIEHFNEFRLDECMEIPKKCLTLKFIENVWQVKITKFKGV